MKRGKNIIKPPAKKVTRREIEVLTLTATGKTRGEISQILSISEETVKDYVVRACRKLYAINKTHAVALAMTLGIITPFERTNQKTARK